MIKSYYKIEFQLSEPLSIGSGEEHYTDKDILRNSKGDPFIPGSSLRGVYRNILVNILGEAAVDQALGFVKIGMSPEDGENQKEGSLIVYDAVIQGKDYFVSIRDGVGLDCYKTAKEGAKFEYEILEPGAHFVTYIEQTRNEDEPDIGKMIADAFCGGQIYLGQKTMRGCGHVEKVNIWCRKFSLPGEKSEWLSFDMYENSSFSEADIYQGTSGNTMDSIVTLKLSLRQKSGISIRRYTTEFKTDDQKKESVPDYVQLYYQRRKKESDLPVTVNAKEQILIEDVPCIPGTSWAGAFRHQIEAYIQKENVAKGIMHEYFGMKDDSHEMKKSRVRFSESQLQGGKWKKNSRNAIDRFTGGTVDGALYTESFYYGGTTELYISYPKGLSVEGVLWRHLLAAAITDLHLGFLAVGGLTAVGRGMFEVEACECNGNEIWTKAGHKEESEAGVPTLYDSIINALEKAEGGTK